MTISIDIISVQGITDKNVIARLYTSLSKFHPVNCRGLGSREHAIHEFERVYTPQNSIMYKIGDFELSRVINNEEIPEFVLVYNVLDDVLPDGLDYFFHSLIYCGGVDRDVCQEVIEFLHVPRIESAIKKKEYEFQSYPDYTRDWMFCEISRPTEEPPFVVIIKSYSKQGMTPMWGQLFYSKDWGLFKGDYDFLEALWKNFMGDAPYDLKQLVKNTIEKCYPSETSCPDEEPIVYRIPLKDMIPEINFLF